MSTGTRTRAAGQASATILAAGGATFAALQVVQQAAGGFNPTVVSSTLMIVAVASTGWALDRLRVIHNRQEAVETLDRSLGASLVYWPLVRARDTDPHELGAFPLRVAPGSEQSAPYVERDVDADLDLLVSRSSFLLVVGASRAGKSRTAAELIKRAQPDRQVVAPTDGDALGALTDDGFEPPWDPSRALLWLDDLERFVEDLPRSALGAAMGGKLGRLVVATMRSAAYDRMLAASGELGSRGKAVLNAAAVVRLESRLSHDELVRARRLYPQLRLDDGELGDALAIAYARSATQPAPGARRADPAVPSGEPSRFDRLLLLAGGLAVAAVIAVAVIIAVGDFHKKEPPPLTDQAEAIKHAGTARGRHTTVSQWVDMHGSGDKAYVVAFQDDDLDKRVEHPNHGDPPQSDEVRIYDQHGGRLRRQFDFQPTNRIAEFSLVAVHDLGGNGSSEIVGGYAPAVAGAAPAPLAIYWDDQRDRYSIAGLDPTRPDLIRLPSRGPGGSYFRGAYRDPIKLTAGPRSLPRGMSVTGYRAEQLVVSTTGGSPRLLLGYVARAPSVKQVDRLEVQADAFHFPRGVPATSRCLVVGRPHIFVPVVRGFSYAAAMLAAWSRYGSLAGCV
jgi:hypothetical protein